MRTLLLLLALFVFSCDCGSVTTEERTQTLGPAIDVEAEPWLMDAFDRAVDFWDEHKIKLDAYESGYVTVFLVDISQMSDPKHIGEYDCHHHTIKILKTLKDNQKLATCVIAHEIGHMLGMNHVYVGKESVGDLMDSATATNPLGGCFFSDKDKNELKRAQSQAVTCE